MYLYTVHVFIEWATDEENRRARKARPTKFSARTWRQVEALFEDQCRKVERNRLTNVRCLKIKQGHKVLLSRTFEDEAPRCYCDPNEGHDCYYFS